MPNRPAPPEHLCSGIYWARVPNLIEEADMSKGQDSKKRDKKKPAKTTKEKQQAKKEKKEKNQNSGILKG
jgi:hypothetical protein